MSNKYDEYEKKHRSSCCAHCGAQYNSNGLNEIEREVFHRDYDGRPSDFTLDDILHNTYTVMCEKCGNVSMEGWEPLCENKYNLNDIINTKEYQDILHSNEPNTIKQIKLMVLKYKDSPLFDVLPLPLLHLIWYCDFMGNEEEFKHYTSIFLWVFNQKNYGGFSIPICKEYRMKASGTFKPTGKKVDEIPLIAFHLKAHHVVADLYRRLGEFEKAYNQMKKCESQIILPVRRRRNIDIFLDQFYKLCKEKNSDRQPIPPLTDILF